MRLLRCHTPSVDSWEAEVLWTGQVLTFLVSATKEIPTHTTWFGEVSNPCILILRVRLVALFLLWFLSHNFWLLRIAQCTMMRVVFSCCSALLVSLQLHNLYRFVCCFSILLHTWALQISYFLCLISSDFIAYLHMASSYTYYRSPGNGTHEFPNLRIYTWLSRQ